MRAAIVTGADHGYFPLMLGLLQSLTQARVDHDVALCVLDFGLEPEEIVEIETFGAKVVRPAWWFDPPEPLRLQRHLGYAARPMIRDYFPGYDTYLWLDADISVQDGGFIADFLHAAGSGRLAIVEEVDPAYRTELYALKWHIGNAFRCFGAADGLRFCLARPINSGAFALGANAPHWTAWQRRYHDAVSRAGRANLDQHALMATLCLDSLPASILGSTHNWICSRARPAWDEHRQVFCRPVPPHDPISVLHLAGRNKAGFHKIKTLDGGLKSMKLTYASPPEPAVEAEAARA